MLRADKCLLQPKGESSSVLRVSPESFDCQVYLEPFEERLNLPAVEVYVRDNKRDKFEVVGYKG